MTHLLLAKPTPCFILSMSYVLAKSINSLGNGLSFSTNLYVALYNRLGIDRDPKYYCAGSIRIFNICRTAGKDDFVCFWFAGCSAK